jgi:LSU ribosomal protein L20P
MSRVKRGILTKKRHKKVLKLAKGYYGARGRLFKSAQETVEKGLVYAYRDRKVKKREFRGQWIVRISAACKENGISYSRFMNALKKKRHGFKQEDSGGHSITGPGRIFRHHRVYKKIIIFLIILYVFNQIGSG